MTNNILAIHGAFSTPRIFSFLKLKMPEYNWKFFDYSDETGNIAGLIKTIINDNYGSKPTHVVGHSMGGLIAIALDGLPWIKSITTIASPLGGLDMTLMQTYLSRSKFLTEISSVGSFVKDVHNIPVTAPTYHILSTNGFNPYVYETNDGVVTLRSQTSNIRGKTFEVKANHSEVMLHEDTVSILKGIWK